MSRGAAAAALSAAVALLPCGCTALADVLQGGGDEPSRGIVPVLSPDVADAAENLGAAAVAVADSLPFPFNLVAYAAGGAAMWVGGKKAIHVVGAVCAAATAKFAKNKPVDAPSSAPAGDVQNADGSSSGLPSAEMPAAAEETAAETETGAIE